MNTHNIMFYGEIRKIIPKLSSNTHLIWSLIYFCDRLPGRKAEVMFQMNEAQVKQEVPGQPTVVGKDHQFILTGVGNQNLMVYSRQPAGRTARVLGV